MTDFVPNRNCARCNADLTPPQDRYVVRFDGIPTSVLCATCGPVVDEQNRSLSLPRQRFSAKKSKSRKRRW